MRTRLSFVMTVAISFGAGLMLASVDRWGVRLARAQGLGEPAIFDVSALKDNDLPTTSVPGFRTKSLFSAEGGAVSVQSGIPPKHLHRNTDEIQYILEGEGKIWVGNELREVKPGMMIVIPRGTPHGGGTAASGAIKAISIKIPPQAKSDLVKLD